MKHLRAGSLVSAVGELGLLQNALMDYFLDTAFGKTKNCPQAASDLLWKVLLCK